MAREISMKKTWEQTVLQNFDNAASNYNENAGLQRDIAWTLAKLCTHHSVPKGLWIDLGSGTGLLAESLENLNPTQSVVRVDISKKMIGLHKSEKNTQLWDLNKGLPTWPKPPKLIASSFVLHWLTNPKERFTEWLNCLDSEGWLALALPIEGSFKEWHHAASKADVPFTGLDLPSPQSLLTKIKHTQIKHNQLITFTQRAQNINSLFKAMIKIGAQSKQKRALSISEWKQLRKAWHLTKNNEVHLTWSIQLLLICK